MLRTTFSIRYYCRKSNCNKRGEAPLEMSITINGERLFLNLPVKFNPNEFAKKRKPRHIQQVIDQYHIKINDVIAELLSEHIPITANTLREYLKQGGVKSKTIQDLWSEYLNVIQKRIGVSISQVVYRRYETTRDICYEVLGQNKEITTIKNSDMVKLYDILKGRYKLSTAGGYFTKVKTTFKYALDNGYMKINPFNGIKIEKGTPLPKFLTESELKSIENADLWENERLIKARDILLFQAYGGGMSYIDMVNFKPERMQTYNNIHIYQGKRHKTGVEFITVIFPKAIEILQKYNNEIPFISNQKLNEYAKEIQKASGITKNITSHLMRKTYASLLINHSVPIATISKMMGHSNTTITTKIYAHTQAETIANEVSNAFDIQNTKV